MLSAAPKLTKLKRMKEFDELINIAKKLRAPDGCPWDRSRKIHDLKEDLLEEAEEVGEALDNKDDENLREELGDLIFNIVLLTVIAEEEGRFEFKDVLQDVAKKIISRHTWVFGDDKAATPEEALKIWAENKAKEKKLKKS
jgi:tetrapyrrole methylase family protein / MazG family protein